MLMNKVDECVDDTVPRHLRSIEKHPANEVVDLLHSRCVEADIEMDSTTDSVGNRAFVSTPQCSPMKRVTEYPGLILKIILRLVGEKMLGKGTTEIVKDVSGTLRKPGKDELSDKCRRFGLFQHTKTKNMQSLQARNYK